MANVKAAIPKGTRDFGPEVMTKRNYIFDTIKKVFKKYGYQEIQTPTMENLDTLTGKYGDEGDQLIFKILNSGDYLSQKIIENFAALFKRYDNIEIGEYRDDDTDKRSIKVGNSSEISLDQLQDLLWVN